MDRSYYLRSPLRTLSGRLLLALVLLATLPLGLVGIGGAAIQREAVAEQSARELAGLARGLAGQLETTLDGLLGDSRAIAALRDVVDLDPARQEAVIGELFHHYPELSRLSTYNLVGRRLASSHPAQVPTVGDRPAFRQALGGRQTWEVGQSTRAGKPALLVWTPIRSPERRVLGVLSSEVELDNLALAMQRATMGGGGRALVLDSAGRVLLQPGFAGSPPVGDFSWLGSREGGRPAGSGTVQYEMGGERFIAGYAPLMTTGWTVVAELPLEMALAPAERSWSLAIASVAMSAMLAVLVAVLMARTLTRPLRRLARAAAAFAAGDPAAPLPRLSPDQGELGLLVATFGRMREAVTAREAALRQSRAEAEAAQGRAAFLADVSRELSASLDYEPTLHTVAWLMVPRLADWCFVDLLDEQERVSRVEVAHADPARAEVAAILRGYPPDPDSPSGIGQVLRTGEPRLIQHLDEAYLAAATRDQAHLAVVSTLGFHSLIVVPLVARGRTLGTLSLVAADSRITYGPDDLALAEEVARRAALAVDNARLYQESQDAIRARDEFLSIAAHELRTPVTIVKGSAQFFLRAQARGQDNPERLTRTLRSIEDATNRLVVLIDDLLDVSRIRAGRLPLHLEPVDLAALVRATVYRYQDQLGDRHRLVPQLEMEPCPILADGHRLEQVLMNLVDNALKYSPDGGDVRIILRRHADGVMVCVRDTGIGLPPFSAEAIFQPFGRATNAAHRHIQGLGLGLYICRSIVERHGGQIWAESPGEGQGTSLCLTLPLASASNIDQDQRSDDPVERPGRVANGMPE